MKKIILGVLMVVSLLAAPAFAADYTVDPAHSHVGFSVQHMVISKVRGAFHTYEGSFSVDEKGAPVQVNAVIDAASIDTGIEKRDDHLRSEDFLQVDKYKNITFQSVSVSPNADGSYTLKGKLTMKGVTRDIELVGTTVGPVKDPWGNMRMGFSAEGLINRKDFDLTWNKVIETGGLLVGDELTLVLEGEGILQE